MSTTLMRAVIGLPKGAAPPSARNVLTILAWHCNELAVRRGHRTCRPSLNTLSRETGLDRTTCLRAIGQLEERRFIEVERRPRLANRYTITDPQTWPVGSVAPPAGGTAQPDAGRTVPPEEVRELLRNFAKQVAPRDQPSRVMRPEQDVRTSEQEPADTNGVADKLARPAHRSQSEQLAYVAAMTKEDH
jgi:DNA-binding transcriptional MocR family regulator